MAPRPLKRVAGIAVLAVMAFGALPSTAEPSLKEDIYGTADSTWTVMIYMAADVDTALPWLLDINELEAASYSDDVNVLVLLDRQELGDSVLLKIEHDVNYFDPTIVSEEIDDRGAVIPGENEVNTGSPEVLRDFVVFCSTQYPADRLVLVMWGHGGGWKGLCPDGYDLLTVPEFGSALSMTEEALGRGIDLLVLDTCNGATLELAYEVREHVDMLVGSEVLVPSEGLPYMETMTALVSDPSQSVVEFAGTIVDNYIEWAVFGSPYHTSMAVFDLDYADDVVGGLERLSRIGVGYDRLYHDAQAPAVKSAECFEDAWYLDLGWASKEVCEADLPTEIKDAALRLALDYRSLVIRHDTMTYAGETDGIRVEGTTGMGIYAPANTTYDEAYSELGIADTSWDELSRLLRSERMTATSGPGPEYKVDDSITDSDTLPDILTLTWTPEPSWNYTSYAAYVFQIRPSGLELCSEIHSAAPIIRVTDAIGNLLVSASAFVDGEAYAHHTFTVDLERLIGLDITVKRGEQVQQGQLEVVTTVDGGEPHRTLCLNGTCTVYIRIPQDAGIGETVLVEVVEVGHDATLSERNIIITGDDVALTLYLHEPAPDNTRTVLLVSAILSLALLGIAFVMYANFLRSRLER